MASSAVGAKLSPACDWCRSKKVRCAGGFPCSQCQTHGQICAFTPRRRPQRKPKQTQEQLVQRLSDLETLLGQTVQRSNAKLPSSSALTPGQIRNNNKGEHNSGIGEDNHLLRGSDLGCALEDTSETERIAHAPQDRLNLLETSPTTTNNTALPQNQLVDTDSHSSPRGLLNQGWDYEDNPHNTREASSVFANEMSYWEYNGPRCIMSVSSAPSLAWIKKRVDLPDIEQSIIQFGSDIMRRLKFMTTVSRLKTAEPTEREAWSFTATYFTSVQEDSYGIVRRPWFERKLRAHFHQSPGERQEDVSWYALRNMIYAYGCRYEVSQKDSFSCAVAQSLTWFENALSVHGDLLCSQSTLVGVHALLLMATFAEGVGTPHVSHALASSAMRLAISKGLHRQPAATWNLSEQEILHRNWTFWAIYCIDRQHAARSGRPMGISDDEISCHIPATCPAGMSINVSYFSLVVTICKMLSRAMRCLSSAEALRQSPEQLVSTVLALDNEIQIMSKSLGPPDSIGRLTDLAKRHADFTESQIVSVHFLYHALILDVHSALAFPWPYRTSGLIQHPRYRGHIERSSALVAEACRSVILATPSIQIDANSSVLTCIYTPIYALMSLFIHLLKSPNLESTASDIILTEMAGGFFARLEYATDLTISFQMLKDVPRFARRAVERAKSMAQEPDIHVANTLELSDSTQVLDPYVVDNTLDFNQECNQLDFDIDLETWSTLFAIPLEEPRELQVT